MKANVIIGKKQIIITSLVLILGAAIYLNWQFADVPQADLETGVSITGEQSTDAQETAGETSSDDQKVLGEATLVNAQTMSTEEYFASARLARDKARDEAVETISSILDDETLSEADKKEANAKALAMTDMIEAESRMENLIKAKGFTDCMVYLSETGANVVVKSEGLTQSQATQIKNIVVSEGSVKGENISITEIK